MDCLGFAIFIHGVVKLITLYMADKKPRTGSYNLSCQPSLACYVITRRGSDPMAIRADSYPGGTFHGGYLGSQNFAVF